MRHEKLWRAILITSMLGLWWLGMQAVHESGHVVAAWSTGGVVAKVVLHPLTFSRTDLAVNPLPLLVSWAGPIGGEAIPAIIFAMAWLLCRRCVWIARTFLGFCLVANGSYLAAGALCAAGDPADMIALGTPPWLAVAIGMALTSAGLFFWNGQGRHFGFSRGSTVNRKVACISAACLVTVVVLELVFSQSS